MPRVASRSSPFRRATNVSLSEALLQNARTLGINSPEARERGLGAEVADTRRRRWLEENQDAMRTWNEHVAEHGLPLDAHRPF